MGRLRAKTIRTPFASRTCVYLISAFLKRRCKDIMKKLPFANFFAKKFQKNAFSRFLYFFNSQIHRFTHLYLLKK